MRGAQNTIGADLRLNGVRPVPKTKRSIARDFTWVLLYKRDYRDEPLDSSTRRIHAILQNYTRNTAQ